MNERRKYKNGTSRLKNWDYRSCADYFVTIRIKHSRNLFGEIRNGKMYLSKEGIIANERWIDTPNHFSNVTLGQHIIMPDHMHGIISLKNHIMIERDKEPSLENMNIKDRMLAISPKVKSLSSIIRTYKGAVSRLIRKEHPNFSWLPRFHERMLRDQEAYRNVTRYIENNPANWKKT